MHVYPRPLARTRRHPHVLTFSHIHSISPTCPLPLTTCPHALAHIPSLTSYACLHPVLTHALALTFKQALDLTLKPSPSHTSLALTHMSSTCPRPHPLSTCPRPHVLRMPSPSNACPCPVLPRALVLTCKPSPSHSNPLPHTQDSPSHTFPRHVLVLTHIPSPFVHISSPTYPTHPLTLSQPHISPALTSHPPSHLTRPHHTHPHLTLFPPISPPSILWVFPIQIQS